MVEQATGVPDWRGEDISVRDDWKIKYSDLRSAENGIDILDGTLTRFGFAVVRDVPVLSTPTAQAEELFKANLRSIGCPVSQSAKLDFLGHVTNRGSDISDPTKRGYESAATLPFHNDRCDLLTLLCLRQAPIGGETRLVCAYTAYRELERSQPDLARVLCDPVPYDLRDTNSPTAWAMMPVFSFENGTFVTRYVRRFIEASQRFEDAPRITDLQRRAFDALDAIIDAPGMVFDLKLQPGEWLFIDNHRLLHARTEFTDSDNPEEARLLLRSWLCWSKSPELPSSFAPTYGRTAAGTYRGGVWPKERPLSGFPSQIDLARQNLEGLLA
jgi:hypothetical protein